MVSISDTMVYKYALDVFAKKHKESYASTLDALAAHLHESPALPANTAHLDDERIRLYFTHVLPLLFDTDAVLQQKAIAAIDALLPHLQHTAYDQLVDWPATKDTITEQYCGRVNALRDRHNSQWHHVWSILVRIIHKDILRSATLINRYLSIVEQGFRNPNLTVRAEAFLCWHVLVELFATHNELLAPKRIKLVCIPLKSSQSKTEHIAVNKFNVWWYLMSEVHNQLIDYTDSIVEPFLVFCFGPLGIQPLIGVSGPVGSVVTAPGKTFAKLTPLVVGALISLLGEPDGNAAALAESVELLALRRPFQSREVFAKIGRALINSAGEASVLIGRLPQAERRNELAACLWRHIVGHVNALRCYTHFNLMLDNLYALESCTTQNPQLNTLTAHIVHTIASQTSFTIASTRNGPADTPSKLDRVFIAIQRVVLLLFSSTITFTPDQIDDVLAVWFDVSAISASTGCNARELTKRLLKFCTSPRPSTGDLSAVRLAMWQRLGADLAAFVDATGIDAADVELVHAFLLMPVQMAGDKFDTFRDRWLATVGAVLDVPGARVGFAARALAALRANSSSASCYNPILASLIDLERADFAASADAPAALFAHVDHLCGTSAVVPVTIKDLNVIVRAVNAFAKRLGGEQLVRMYKCLKTTVTRLESTAAAMRCDRALCAEFRTIVQQHVRKRKATQTLIRELRADGDDAALRKELLDMVTGADDEFVVIPSVWKFNPDRLTDQQRDKMKERRADIPALYNDTSQSQESRSIKPWTPQKVVMPTATAEPAAVIDAKTATDGAAASPEAAAVVIAKPVGAAGASKNACDAPETTALVDKKVGRAMKLIEMDIKHADEYQLKPGATRSTRNASKRVSDSLSPPMRCSVVVSADEREMATRLTPKQQRRKSVDSYSSAKKTSTRKRTATKLDNIEESESDQPDNPERKAAKPKSRKSLVLDQVVGEPKPAAVAPVSPAKPAEREPEPPATLIVLDSQEEEVLKASLPVENGKSVADTSATDEIETSQELLQPRLSARKTPTKVCTNNMDTLPMDTECAQEVPQLAQQVDGRRIEELATLAAAEKPAIQDAADVVLAGAETQSQVSQLSTLNITPVDVSMEEVAAEAAAVGNALEQQQDMLEANTPPGADSQGDETIRCSPVFNDLEQRNADLLNDTLTISPIKGDGKQTNAGGEDDSSNNSSPTKAAGNRESSVSPPTISPPDKLPSADALSALATAQTATIASPSTSQTVRLVSTSTPQSCQAAGSPSTRFSQFQGRGAQLLSIIANKKKPLTTVLDTALEPITTNASATVDPLSSNETTAVVPSAEPREAVENAEPQPQQPSAPPGFFPTPKRSLLTFSKALPSPLASPSSSILKRKYPLDDTLPAADAAIEMACSTPVLKKKRVSFHDPPVSVTKEYIGHADEHVDRQSLNKLIMQQQHQQQLARSPGYARSPLNGSGSAAAPNGSAGSAGGSAQHRLRHVLRRKSRADSMVEFAKLNKMAASTNSCSTNAAAIASAAVGLSAEAALTSLAAAAANAAAVAASQTELEANATADMEPLQWNASAASAADDADPERPESASGSRLATLTRRSAILGDADADADDMISTAELNELIAAPAEADIALRSYDKDTLLQYVFDKFGLEEVLAKYAVDATATARQLTRELSTLMRADERVCRETLDALSENHSAQFLNHAIVENLGSTVCSQLAPAVLVEHLRDVAKESEAVRTDLCGLVAQMGATGRAAEELQGLDEDTRKGLVALGEQLKASDAPTMSTTTTAATASSAATRDPSARTERTAAPTTTTTTTTANEIATLERMLTQHDTSVSDAEMAVLRKLLARPMSDEHICDFMVSLGRNRKN